MFDAIHGQPDDPYILLKYMDGQKSKQDCRKPFRNTSNAVVDIGSHATSNAS